MSSIEVTRIRWSPTPPRKPSGAPRGASRAQMVTKTPSTTRPGCSRSKDPTMRAIPTTISAPAHRYAGRTVRASIRSRNHNSPAPTNPTPATVRPYCKRRAGGVSLVGLSSKSVTTTSQQQHKTYSHDRCRPEESPGPRRDIVEEEDESYRQQDDSRDRCGFSGPDPH